MLNFVEVKVHADMLYSPDDVTCQSWVGIIHPFWQAERHLSWLENWPAWLDGVPFEIPLMQMKLIKMNQLERDAELWEVRTCWAQDPGSSANIMMHLFFFSHKTRAQTLNSSLYVHMLIWIITSVTLVAGSVCVCLCLHMNTHHGSQLYIMLCFVTVNCTCMEAPWGMSLAKAVNGLTKGQLGDNQRRILFSSAFYTIHKWCTEKYCWCLQLSSWQRAVKATFKETLSMWPSFMDKTNPSEQDEFFPLESVC